MSAKRQKVERQQDPSETSDDLHLLLSEASTPVPGSRALDEDFSFVKSEGEELPQEQLEEDEDEDEELPPYHELHHYRKLRSMARRLMKHRGLDLNKYGSGVGILTDFFQRYHSLEDAEAGTKASAYWKFSFEQTDNSTWPWYRVRATLTAHSLNERQFKGDWCNSERLAEKSAINAFREDPEVSEIAKRLPPIMKRLRENLKLSKAEKSSIEAAGIQPRDVVNELMHTVYMYFRDLGCRTALWDGNT